MKEIDTFNRRRRRINSTPQSTPNGESRMDLPQQQQQTQTRFSTYTNTRFDDEELPRNDEHGNDKDRNHGSHRCCWLWCRTTKNKLVDKVSKLTRKQFRLLVACKLVLVVFKLLLLHWLFSASSTLITSRHFLGRPETDKSLNEIPLLLPVFDFSEYDSADIGGWRGRHVRRFFQPRPLYGTEPTTPLLDASGDSDDIGGWKGINLVFPHRLPSSRRTKFHTKPDYGGLSIHFPLSSHPPLEGTLASSHQQQNGRLAPKRNIRPEDDRPAHEYRNNNNETKKGYSIIRIRDRQEWPEDVEDKVHTCRSPNWVLRYHPLCNTMHEFSLLGKDDDKHYASHGSFRDVWLVDHHYPANNNKNNNNHNNNHNRTQFFRTALKMSRWKIDYNRDTYAKILSDATVMKQLTASPRIVDIYSHCGTSVWVEPMPNEVEEVIVKGEGLIKQNKLHDEDELKPRNPYTIEEKLDIALAMAESVADLHGFRDGVIVHDDIQLSQWLKTPDGRLKLGDFNRARILEYSTTKERYCKYTGGGRSWRYRAPEEYDRNLGGMDEKIDVYSFGNGIYSLLTGLWVFYEVDDDETPKLLVKNGTRAFVDPRWKQQGTIASKLVEVMEGCWQQNATERMSIFEVVKELKEIKKEHKQRKKERR